MSINRILKFFKAMGLLLLCFTSISHAEIYKISAASVLPLSADIARIYMEGGARLIKLKSNTLEFTSGTLKNKRMGIISSTTFQDYAKSNYSNSLEIKTYLYSEDNEKALSKNKIDFIFDDITVFDYHDRQDISTVEFFDPQIDDPRWSRGKSAYFCKADSLQKDKLNTALIKQRTTKEFQKISQKYFHKDIY